MSRGEKIDLFGSPSQRLGNLAAEVYKQLRLLAITKQNPYVLPSRGSSLTRERTYEEHANSTAQFNKQTWRLLQKNTSRRVTRALRPRGGPRSRGPPSTAVSPACGGLAILVSSPA